MKLKKYMMFAITVFLLCSALVAPALAIEESEVESAIAASSREEVAGNIFIWFLCAIAFLKVSQKIDSFMSALGINVGRTGGSMLGELMIAGRAIGAAAGAAGGAISNIFNQNHNRSNTTNQAAGQAFPVTEVDLSVLQNVQQAMPPLLVQLAGVLVSEVLWEALCLVPA